MYQAQCNQMGPDPISLHVAWQNRWYRIHEFLCLFILSDSPCLKRTFGRKISVENFVKKNILSIKVNHFNFSENKLNFVKIIKESKKKIFFPLTFSCQMHQIYRSTICFACFACSVDTVSWHLMLRIMHGILCGKAWLCFASDFAWIGSIFIVVQVGHSKS